MMIDLRTIEGNATLYVDNHPLLTMNEVAAHQLRNLLNDYLEEASDLETTQGRELPG